jgi:hypothetical protein
MAQKRGCGKVSNYKVRFYVVRLNRRIFESFDASEAIQYAIDNGGEYVSNERIYIEGDEKVSIADFKKSLKSYEQHALNIDKQIKKAKRRPNFFRKPPYCHAVFPCDDKQVRAHYNHNKLKQPIQFCLFAEMCNQRTFKRREAISPIGFARQ